jgi:mycothiol synthase
VAAIQVDCVTRLDDRQRSEVLSLVEAATRVDRTEPLSEQVLLGVRGTLPTGPEAAPSPDSRHFLAYADTRLAGYAHLDRSPAGKARTAEIVVDPTWRRLGVGTTLVHTLEKHAVEKHAVEKPPESPTTVLQLWSHGHLEPARAFAVRDRYSVTRELWKMRRPLRPDERLPAIDLPEGFRARTFVVGQDEEAWLRVNARAFADHPEQGRMTRRDLEQRIAEPWFDASGFLLIEDTRGRAPALAASHWTKVVPSDDPQVSPTQGEVYVVGVDPLYQGLGLGTAVTILGLEHLRERGITEAILYVDADNRAAIATYTRLGFTRFSVDVMYSPTVHPPV